MCVMCGAVCDVCDVWCCVPPPDSTRGAEPSQDETQWAGNPQTEWLWEWRSLCSYQN